MLDGSLALAFLAGVLSVLSPCVLPILPIVLGAAVAGHRLGPAALAAGLALSFVAAGLFVATIGFSIGLDGSVLRYVAGFLMVLIGAVLLAPPLQARLAAAAGPVSNWAQGQLDGGMNGGLATQFWVGILLGAAWSPCVGPTLGAASLLAARGENLSYVAITMFVFGIGAAVPLLLLGMLSREAMMRWRNQLMSGSQFAKATFGAVFIILGALILTGVDKSLEAALVEASPQWLTDLTTRF